MDAINTKASSDDSRTRVILLDRFGYDMYHHPNGKSFLPADQHLVRLVTDVGRLHEAHGAEIDMAVGVSPYDEDAIMEAARYLHSAGGAKADRVVTLTEMLLVPTARLREEVGIRGQGVDQALLFRDKVQMKRHLAERGVVVPDFAVFTEDNARSFLRRYGRVVVKPRSSAGSLDAFVVSNNSDLDDFVSSHRDGADTFEVEEFVEGQQYTVDSIVRNGTVVLALANEHVDSTLAFRTLQPFREVSVPEGPLLQKLLEFNRQVVACYPRHTGLIHQEVFLRDSVPVFCEVTCRAGGGGVATCFESRTGIHLYETLLRSQITDDVPAAVPVLPHATGFVLVYGGPGTLVAPLVPPDEPWVLKAETYANPGDKVPRPRYWGEMLAMVSVRGLTNDEVRERLDVVITAMKPQIRA